MKRSTSHIKNSVAKSCPRVGTSGSQGEHKEKVKEGKYCGSTVYSCMKIKNETY
jgi:hypothetical protein